MISNSLLKLIKDLDLRFDVQLQTTKNDIKYGNNWNAYPKRTNNKLSAFIVPLSTYKDTDASVINISVNTN